MTLKKKNNILFLLHMPPPVHGSSVVGSYIKNSKIINEEFNCTYLNVLASSSISRTGKISIHKLFGFFITLVKLLYILVRNRPDLSYIALTTTGAAFFKDVLLVMLLKIFGVKRIYHLHNKGVIIHQDKFFYRFFYRLVFKDTAVILLSNSLYSDISKFVAPANVYICPNGIPVPPKSEENNGGKNGPCNILFLSNLIETKGVSVLLNACTILKKQQQNFICRFIGGEGDITGKELKLLIRNMGLTGFVVYEGKKYGDEKHATFSSANIFVFPTYYQNECFPLVLLEAMSYSLPVITTREGGISDIVDDGKSGFLIVARDEYVLAEKLKVLLENKDLRLAMGEAGKKKYLEEFTVEKFEKKLSSIINECIG